MTTTFILLCGAGIGALITTLLMLSLLRAWSGKNIDDTKEETRRVNKLNTDLLAERNNIGERQIDALNQLVQEIRDASGRK